MNYEKVVPGHCLLDPPQSTLDPDILELWNNPHGINQGSDEDRMPIIVDGHNLIPHIPGIELSDPDDEVQLIYRLLSYCERSGRRLTVYFDSGFPGQEERQWGNNLTVHFVSPSSHADLAIMKHIQELGREAPNWTVVSDDREIKFAAQQARARTLSSSEFAALIKTSSDEEDSDDQEKPEQLIDDAELQEWERLFQNQGKSKKGSR